MFLVRKEEAGLNTNHLNNVAPLQPVMSMNTPQPPLPPPDLLFSSPPQDLQKPSIPYFQSQKFTVFRHNPPPPIGKPYPHRRTLIPRESLDQMTQLEHCLSAPPLEGTPNDDEPFSFTITKEISVRDGRGAQIVVVNHWLVAKIYDPLYYPTYHQDSSIRADVVAQAERDYSREAATYKELNGLFGGTIIPEYHGSWTCDVPVDTAFGATKRPVRLVLMELVEGVSMLELDPTQLSEDQKSKHHGQSY